MNDDDLKRLFVDSESAPDPAKKQQAILAATEEFEKSFTDTQGIDSSSRPMEDNTVSFPTSERKKKMTATNNRWMYTGWASAAGVVLAVSLVVNQDILRGPEPELDDFGRLIEPLSSIRKPKPTDTLDYENYDLFPSAEHNYELEEVVVTPPKTVTVYTPSGEPILSDADRAFQQAQEAAIAVEMEMYARQAKEKQNSRKQGRVMAAPSPMLEEVVVGDPWNPNRDNQAANDQFEFFESNPINLVVENPVSTFSIDVDTAAYSYVRRQLKEGYLPQKAAVRLEEMVNYFSYNYPVPSNAEAPFEPTVSVVPSPWNETNKLVHIGIKGYELPVDRTVRTNLVFLLDVSGSMSDPDKLPLVKQSLSLLLSQLHPEDTISIAVYAGAAGTVLEPTKVRDRQKIRAALNQLEAGGSTAGAQGIKLAYELAEASYVEGGINRILLATDGDFNVGISDPDQLQGFVERQRDKGIYLSVLGFGQGNYQDALMQKLAQNGNGVASYIDSLSEARKVLVDEAQSQLFAIANDVKIQVEFNPETVSEYRLLGYETRALEREDFNNDQVDAGEIGSGHTVTAIYEITPKGSQGLVDESRYNSSSAKSQERHGDEYGFLKMRYKLPGESTSKLITRPIASQDGHGTNDVNFSIAVAGFAQLLKDGKYVGDWNFDDALELAQQNRGEDLYGYRAEFVQLIRAAMVAEEMY